jgi:RNA polymerase sigma-B factor
MARLTSPESVLLEYRRSGDSRLRDQLVAERRRLAYSVARRFEGRGEESDDLQQGGFTTQQVKQAIHALYTLRRNERESLESAEPADAGVTHDEIGRLLDRLTVDGLLAELEPRQRNIIELRYFRDLTQAEIATRVRMSNMHVSRLLRRGIETMKVAARENERQRVA